MTPEKGLGVKSRVWGNSRSSPRRVPGGSLSRPRDPLGCIEAAWPRGYVCPDYVWPPSPYKCYLGQSYTAVLGLSLLICRTQMIWFQGHGVTVKINQFVQSGENMLGQQLTITESFFLVVTVQLPPLQAIGEEGWGHTAGEGEERPLGTPFPTYGPTNFLRKCPISSFLPLTPLGAQSFGLRHR